MPAPNPRPPARVAHRPDPEPARDGLLGTVQHGPTPRPIKVLFVGGYGRSGSTLLDRLVGQVDGFCSIGELRHVFREGYLENRLCGCGRPFRECPFWRAVTAQAYGPMESVDARELLDVQRRVDHWWRIPQLGWGLGGAGRRAELARYQAQLRALYRAIAAVSGASVIVDSSKDVSHGYVLRGLGEPIRPYVVHLVRDSRAVAHSWQRRKFNPGNARDMNRYGLLRTCAEWNVINALTALHRRAGGGRYALLRYRDLAADPAGALRRVLALLDERDREIPVSPAGDVVLGEEHTAAGNPVRFHRGELRIRADEEWRSRMSPVSRAVVTALTLPALTRYTAAAG